MWTRKLPVVALLSLLFGAACLLSTGCGMGSPVKVDSLADLENELHPKVDPKAEADKTPKKAATAKTPEEKAAKPFTAEMANTVIKGVCLFEGTLPTFNPTIKTSEECAAIHKHAPLLKEDYIVTDGKLANVVVYVSKSNDAYSFDNFSLPPARINQVGCQYVPHVLALMTDQRLEVESSDPFSHNIHIKPQYGAETNFSQGTPGIAPTKPKYDTPELGISVRCDVHTWMLAWICVFQHPFYAITKTDGTFEFKVPPGKYEISVWHESSAKMKMPKTIPVDVAPEKPGDLKFSFSKK